MAAGAGGDFEEMEGPINEPIPDTKSSYHVGFKLGWSAEHDRPPYLLRSLVVHSGEAGGGHYTAYVRGQDNVWYFYTDWYAPLQRV